MPTVDILNIENKKVGTANLNDNVFASPVKESLFYETVKMQLANRRAGTASTKTRANVSGGGVKPWKQKGTGRARAGSIRSPLWRHGGTVFGPHPRDYSYKLPKKVREGAIRSVLALKLKEGRLRVLDEIKLNEPKTKGLAVILKKINSNKGLIVIDGSNPNLELAVRNLKDFKLLKINGINTFDLLLYDDLIITKAAVEQLEKKLL
ncbi:MAG: 50S ribosomal protein L4 [Deltaproteobacteria bacterium GWC2_42_51]|nr:MAG: 50S ribosomal protein L4 [Deltaproteobacteria bacterium GWA2_42_85]OGP32684.1 MAG: 50S ribosomal protein L4 [Deltaproteobacteria bacterium GWC2_42_51]OGP39125.1 MAG: 50S ribosomal protein L4 [Deltaproteobacteria bacterium GWD2_42_10]OGP47940.1 MAG: 50S ribosomal protein L4 [Deltaproteobacteria bacterium GWF2_42_12]OGQ24769.1 MAG: 50S ribosomal protein L4 [Deltaproteobacteria bacterium RIFCSPHIGHO2_02_FULL_42_44]OGQ36817.1 MAG: 50S ribosomal protein L4 [Deltaproteobacteria bacterium RIF